MKRSLHQRSSVQGGKILFSVTGALLVLVLARPLLAGELQVCVGGADDGKVCPPAVCAAPGVCKADDVRAYAKGCYDRLGIEPLPGPFRCKDGKQLVVTVDGVIQDIHCPKDKGNDPTPSYKSCTSDTRGFSKDKAGAFPQKCDNPAWLPNSEGQCYGNSYIQEISGITGKDGKPLDSVRAALLCRHKLAWSDGDKDFPDIAMVIHNDKNGETCWFQTNDNACPPNKCSNDGTQCTSDSDCESPGVCVAAKARCDGTKVPAPDAQAAAAFWLPPSRAARINCVSCHDNGPFMNSRWMNNTINLEDDLGKYVNNGFGFSQPSADHPAWLKPTFVTVRRAGLDPKLNASACTGCHKIHPQAKTPDEDPPFGRDYFTFKRWLDFTTGNATPKGAKFTGAAIHTGTGFKIAYWMPVDDPQRSAETWTKVYKKHVDKLRACMSATEEDLALKADDPNKVVKDCQKLEIAMNDNPNHLAPGAGARLYASLDGGQTYPPGVSFSVAWPPHAGGPISMTAGTSPIVAWEADPNFTVCTIEATFPPGVVSPNHVGTASNWSLPDRQVDIGELTKPGRYRFDIYCDLEQSNPEQSGRLQAASLTFKVEDRPKPPTGLRAVAH